MLYRQRSVLEWLIEVDDHVCCRGLVEDGALLVDLQPIIPLHIIRAIGTVRYLQAIGELCGTRWVIHDTDKVTVQQKFYCMKRFISS